MKNNKGITLISIIITIIVIILLAGILIINIVDDKGIISKTNEAQFKTEIEQYKEELKISILNDEIAKNGNRTTKFNRSKYEEIKEIIPSFDIKYTNILIVKEDNLVFVGKDEEIYKLALQWGLIPDSELLDDEILEELQPFITEWTVNENDSITLPVSGKCNFEVDYGDGTKILKVTSATDEDRIHTYEKAGTYIVTIKGDCQSFNFNSINVSKDKITKIVQWGVLGKGLSENSYSFTKCSNLKGEIPSPSLNSFKKVKYFATLFQDCISLTGPIPENLFANATNAISFGAGYWNGCFMGCTNLTGIIPENLFANCLNVTIFNNMFYNCKNLTGSIPKNLFKNNLKVNGFQNVFGRL